MVSVDVKHHVYLLTRDGTHFLPGADALSVYVRASTLCCFDGLVNAQTFPKALSASVDRCSDVKSECRTLRASFSGTFLRSLPELIVAPLTEGTLFISAQLFADAVSTLRKVWVLMRLWEQHTASKNARKHEKILSSTAHAH